MGRRMTESVGSRTLLYSYGWQVLEEEVAGSMDDQYVWSPVYVDALVERDTPTQRLYVQQDANWNTTTITNASGTAFERYGYDPFGAVIYLNASWTTISASAYAWINLFQGGRWNAALGL